MALSFGFCPCAIAAAQRHLGQHGCRQDDFVGAIVPPQHFGQTIGTFAATHARADDFPSPIADHGPILATPGFQSAGQDILLAVAHQRRERAVLQASLVWARLAQGSGFRIGQPAFDYVTRPFQTLQGCHRVVAAQAARECIGHSARQEVNLAGAAISRARRDDLDANRQGSCLKHGHELAQGAAFPLGDVISRWSGHCVTCC
jgi:hypothetical protein